MGSETCIPAFFASASRAWRASSSTAAFSSRLFLRAAFFDRPASFAATMAGLGGGALGVPVRVASLDGAGPGSPVLADLDGDGAAELLVTPEATAQLTLLRNVGNGTFAPPQQEPIFSPRTVAVGDLDRDGRPDVVVDGPGVRGVRLLRTGCRP